MLTFDRTSDPPGFRCAARGHALELPLEAVSVPKPGNTWWAHPANFVFGTEGVRVAIASAHGASGVEISLDSNDEYHLVVMRGEGSTLFAANLPAVRNGGGLATRTLPFDREIELEPGDFIAVTPVHGDGRYSIGHLRLVQSVAEPNR